MPSNIFDDDLNSVAGGMPNPSCYKMRFEDIPYDKRSDENFMHWWRIFNGRATEEDKKIEEEKRRKGIVG